MENNKKLITAGTSPRRAWEEPGHHTATPRPPYGHHTATIRPELSKSLKLLGKNRNFEFALDCRFQRALLKMVNQFLSKSTVLQPFALEIIRCFGLLCDVLKRLEVSLGCSNDALGLELADVKLLWNCNGGFPGLLRFCLFPLRPTLCSLLGDLGLLLSTRIARTKSERH